MKALEISEPGVVQLVDRADPQPSEGEALLQVKRVGYCGSDLNSFRGLNPLVTYPRVPGHEIAATIVELGSGVDSRWQTGTDVLINPYSNCGECSSCQKGRPNCCRNNQTLGVQRDGALCEYVAIPAEKLIVANKLSVPELALVEPLTVGFHAATRGRVTEQDTVAVLGCGAIGLGVVGAATYKNARVIAVDIDDAKLELAVACGAHETINSRTSSLHGGLNDLTDGHGPDVIVEAVGHPSTYRAAVEEVCFAGRVVFIGWAKPPIEFETKLFVLKELDIVGSRNALPEDFASVVTMLESTSFPGHSLITKTAPLADAAGALGEWDQNPGAVTRIHIELTT